MTVAKTDIYFATRKTASAHVHIAKGTGIVRVNRVQYAAIFLMFTCRCGTACHFGYFGPNGCIIATRCSLKGADGFTDRWSNSHSLCP